MRTLVVVAALMGFAGVALGAFAAHALRGSIETSLLDTFETGVRYHIYHALAMLLAALLAEKGGQLAVAAGWTFFAGIVVFSGSLYLLSVTGTRWLGAVTPLGGLALLTGWLLLAWSFLRS